MTTIKLVFYLAFLFMLAIWMGSAFHDTYSTNRTWYQDPLTHIKHLANHPIPGAMNPWPLSTAIFTLITLISLILFIQYHGQGKTLILSSIGGSLFILITTFLYFVPGLIRIFGKTSAFSDQDLINMSHQWVILNVIRVIVLMVLFVVGLVGLVRIYKPLSSL